MATLPCTLLIDLKMVKKAAAAAAGCCEISRTKNIEKVN
jgi:hypothetical protein